MRDYAILGLFVFSVALAAAFGAQFQPGLWYGGLHKPPLNPPNWVFGPVWSALYLAIAAAGWLVWRARPESPIPLTLWTAQLLLNAAWSYLFFGLRRPGAALLEILFLLAVLVATTAVFFRIGRVQGVLFLPYAIWVTFAAYLNAGIWFLNR